MLVDTQAVDGGQQRTAIPRAIERRLTNSGQAISLLAELRIGARIVHGVVVLDGLQELLLGIALEAELARKLLQRVGLHHQAAVQLLLVCLIDGLVLQRGLPRVGRAALGLENLHVGRGVHIEHLTPHAAGMRSGGEGDGVVVRGLVGDALAVAINLQERLGAKVELAVGRPIARLVHAGVLTRLDDAAVEHHGRAHAVHVSARPKRRLDAGAGVVRIVVQRGDAAHGLGVASLQHVGVRSIAAACQDNALLRVDLLVPVLNLEDGARHGTVAVLHQLHQVVAIQHLAAIVLDDLRHGLDMLGLAALVHEAGVGHMMALGRDEVGGAAGVIVLGVDDDLGLLAEMLRVRVGDPLDGGAGVLDPRAQDGLVVFEGRVTRVLVDPAALVEVEVLLLLPARMDGANVVMGCGGLGALLHDHEVRAQLGQRGTGHDAGHARADDQHVGFDGFLDVAGGDFRGGAQPIDAGSAGGGVAVLDGGHVGGALSSVLRGGAAGQAQCGQGAHAGGAGQEAAAAEPTSLFVHTIPSIGLRTVFARRVRIGSGLKQYAELQHTKEAQKRHHPAWGILREAEACKEGRNEKKGVCALFATPMG